MSAIMKILLIRPGALGDTILTLPIVDAILQVHPGSEITFLGSKQYGFLLPPRTKMESFDGLRWAWLFEERRPCRSPRKTEFDLAYVILKNSKTVVVNLRNAGIETIEASSDPNESESLVESLCGRLSLPVPERKAYLQSLQTVTRINRIWIGPGSGSRNKNAPIPLFSKTCDILKTHYDLQLDVTLGEPDNWLLENNDFKQFTSQFTPTTTYNKSLHHIITTYCNSCLFIGNDSGVAHLAAALNVPCILFFTVTNPKVWAPWAPGKNLLILQLEIGNISSDNVFERFYDQILSFAKLHLTDFERSEKA